MKTYFLLLGKTSTDIFSLAESNKRINFTWQKIKPKKILFCLGKQKQIYFYLWKQSKRLFLFGETKTDIFSVVDFYLLGQLHNIFFCLRKQKQIYFYLRKLSKRFLSAWENKNVLNVKNVLNEPP